MGYEWERKFRSHILSRGWDYAVTGMVSEIRRNQDTVTALVEGTEYYRVEIGYDGPIVREAYCSCPYAAEGNWCKHMAAVLYEIEDGALEDTNRPLIKENKPEIIHSSIRELISSVDREKLEKILLGLVGEYPKVENYIRSSISDRKASADISNVKKEIDSIFKAFSDRGGYIDYCNANDFERSLTSLLKIRTLELIENDRYKEAFDLSTYAFVRAGNCDIDDDGQIEMIANACSRIWSDILSNCLDETRNYIREWFEEKAGSGIVYDFMDEYLSDFLKYELASKEEILEEIQNLDKIVEECKKRTECARVFSCLYGYYIDAFELRIKLMKKLGATDEEVDAYRGQYWNFKSVREYFYNKAEQENNVEEQIRILVESKIIDKDSEYRVYRYSERLIDIYHELGDYEREKKERYEGYINYYNATMDEFRKYREMCSENEWLKQRRNLIDSKEDIEIKCSLLAEESLLDDLYETILNQKDKLALVNKYGFLLAEKYSGYILEFYRKHVIKLADVACNRSRYDELIRYLLRMRHYNGGDDLVTSLCTEWCTKYPTRRVMVEELSKLSSTFQIQ